MSNPPNLSDAVNITSAVVVEDIYSDVAIETALVIKSVFNSSLQCLKASQTRCSNLWMATVFIQAIAVSVSEPRPLRLSMLLQVEGL